MKNIIILLIITLSSCLTKNKEISVCKSTIITKEEVSFIKDLQIKEYILKHYSGKPLYQSGIIDDSAFLARGDYSPTWLLIDLDDKIKAMKKAGCITDTNHFVIKSGDRVDIIEGSRKIYYNYTGVKGKTTSFHFKSGFVCYSPNDYKNFRLYKNDVVENEYPEKGTLIYNQIKKEVRETFPEFKIPFD